MICVVAPDYKPSVTSYLLVYVPVCGSIFLYVSLDESDEETAGSGMEFVHVYMWCTYMYMHRLLVECAVLSWGSRCD